MIIKLIYLFLDIRVHSICSVRPLEQPSHKAHPNMSFIPLCNWVDNLSCNPSHTKVRHVQPSIRGARGWLRGCTSSPTCSRSENMYKAKDIHFLKKARVGIEKIWWLFILYNNISVIYVQKKDNTKGSDSAMKHYFGLIGFHFLRI